MMCVNLREFRAILCDFCEKNTMWVRFSAKSDEVFVWDATDIFRGKHIFNSEKRGKLAYLKFLGLNPTKKY